MNEWDRTDMGFPRALADAAAFQHASAQAASSRTPSFTYDSAGELTLTWLEVFDESSDSI